MSRDRVRRDTAREGPACTRGGPQMNTRNIAIVAVVIAVIVVIALFVL
jgi:hypothetical protein